MGEFAAMRCLSRMLRRRPFQMCERFYWQHMDKLLRILGLY